MLIGAVFTANFIPQISEMKLIYTDFIASPSQMMRDTSKPRLYEHIAGHRLAPTNR